MAGSPTHPHGQDAHGTRRLFAEVRTPHRIVLGIAAAQESRYPATTGALPQSAPQQTPEWSGQSGASGHPLMTTEAIRASAANFHGCIQRLWPAASRRGISRKVFAAYTETLTPDLRIMDLLDNQPEFTKSIWDYLDILVTDERIQRGRELLEKFLDHWGRAHLPDVRDARARLAS